LQELREFLKKLLTSPVPEKRAAAVRALAIAWDSGITGEMVDFLGWDDQAIRKAAVWGIMHLKLKEAVNPLLRLLPEADPDLQLAAIEALGSIGAQEAVGPILRLLEKKLMPSLHIVKKSLQGFTSRWQELQARPERPVCCQCLVRFQEKVFQKGVLTRLKAYVCPRCYTLMPHYAGVSRVAVLLDRDWEAAGKTGPVLKDGVLTVPWWPRERPADLDEMVVGQVNPGDIQLFLIEWGQKAQRENWPPLQTVPAVLRPGARLDENDRRLLMQHCAGVMEQE
jgi:hypothetical protein